MKKSRTYWLTRDKRVLSPPSYEIWMKSVKPKYRNGEYPAFRALGIFCSKEWERLTGIKIKPGEIKLIKITMELMD